MNTKSFILQQTFRLLVEKEYKRVSVTDICQILEMTRGLLDYSPQSKEKLFAKIADIFLIKNLQKKVNY